MVLTTIYTAQPQAWSLSRTSDINILPPTEYLLPLGCPVATQRQPA